MGEEECDRSKDGEYHGHSSEDMAVKYGLSEGTNTTTLPRQPPPMGKHPPPPTPLL